MPSGSASGASVTVGETALHRRRVTALVRASRTRNPLRGWLGTLEGYLYLWLKED